MTQDLTLEQDATHPLDRFLYKKIFGTKELDHFRAQYIDDVDPQGWEPLQAVATHDDEDDTGKMRVFVMNGGVAVARFEGVDGELRWTAYETKERVERNAHFGRWADFARGRWTRECPTEPGLYPVAPLASAIPETTPFAVWVEYSFRRLSRHEGVVIDVSGYRPAGKRTEWQGYWWSEPLPLMLAPTRNEV